VVNGAAVLATTLLIAVRASRSSAGDARSESASTFNLTEATA